MVRVDDEIALVELAEGLQEISLAGTGGAAPAGLLPENLLPADHDDPKPGQGKSLGDLPLAQDETSGRSPGLQDLPEKGGLRARHGERVILEEMNHAVHLLFSRAQVVDEKPLAGPAPDFLGHGGQQAFLALDEGGLLRPQAQVRLDAETDGAAIVLRADLDCLDHDSRPVPDTSLRVLLRKKENALVEMEFFLFLCPEEETADFVSRLLVGPCRGQRVVDNDESPGRDVVRQALEAS